jgi:hypothetical protein
MSLEQLGSNSYALRSLWEATLYDEKDSPLNWTTGLMVSTNIPKLKFTVEPIFAGNSKGYRGWELPDALSLVMRETSDHALENYLDEWMMGKTGVFDPAIGAFRSSDSVSYLYRKVRVRTFYYKYTSGENINVKIHEAIRRGADEYAIQVSNETKKLTGKKLSIKSQEYLREQAYTVMVSEYAKGAFLAPEKQEDIKANPVLVVERKQAVPLVDKLAALASGAANQAVSRIPSSNLTRAVMPPVVIPPPLLRVPVATGSLPPIPRHLQILVDFNVIASSKKERRIELYDIGKKYGGKSDFDNIKGKKTADSVKEKNDGNTVDLKTDMSEDIRKVSFNAAQSTKESIVNITGGKAVDAKKWKASEVTTASVTYTCAIEGYDIGTYDYQTGDGVQYTISLPVCDIKID